MNEPLPILRQLGFSPTEAHIYLAGVSRPKIGVAELQKITGIKRPTIYHALNLLSKRGLVAKTQSVGRTLFHFAPPTQLKILIRKQQAELTSQAAQIEQLIPLLTTTANDTVSVAHYEGIEGIKTVVDAALYCRLKEWAIIAPKVNFFSQFTKEYAEYYLKTRQRHGITARSLWEQDATRRLPRDSEIIERNPRYLPPALEGTFQSVIIIFDDSIAIISSIDELSAILITSRDVTNLLRAMFEGLWQISQSIEK